MVKLTEVEDEHFSEKPATTKDNALLAEDDDEYTDTGTTLSPSWICERVLYSKYRRSSSTISAF